MGKDGDDGGKMVVAGTHTKDTDQDSYNQDCLAAAPRAALPDLLVLP